MDSCGNKSHIMIKTFRRDGIKPWNKENMKIVFYKALLREKKIRTKSKHMIIAQSRLWGKIVSSYPCKSVWATSDKNCSISIKCATKYLVAVGTSTWGWTIAIPYNNQLYQTKSLSQVYNSATKHKKPTNLQQSLDALEYIFEDSYWSI